MPNLPPFDSPSDIKHVDQYAVTNLSVVGIILGNQSGDKAMGQARSAA